MKIISSHIKRSLFLLLLAFLVAAIASCGGGGKTTLPAPGGNNNQNDQSVDLPVIDLTPPNIAENPGDLGGVIKDALSVPLGDVEVSIDDAEISGMTDEQGQFLISEVAGGTHTVTFSKDGHVLYEQTVNVDGNTPFNITATSADTRTPSQVPSGGWAGLRGLVFQAGTDTPIPGAWIVVFNFENGFFRVARSGENGKYGFDRLPAGTMHVLGFKRGFEVYFGTVTLTGGHNTELNIPLVAHNSGNVEGWVTNVEGNPIVRASVFLLSYRGEGYGPKFHTFTNGEGYYSFENVPAGEADMLAAHRYYKPAAASVVVIPGATIEQNFRLERRESGEFAVLEGVVRNPQEQPIAGALIKLTGEGDQMWKTESRENGSYRLELPHPGHYGIYAIKQGFNPFEGTIELAPGVNQKNITLTPVGENHLGKVKGHAYLLPGENEQFPPAAGALTHLWGLGERDGVDFETHANSDGFYIFEQVPAGNYKLHALFEGYQEFNAEIGVEAGQITVKDIYFEPIEPQTGFGQIWVYVRDQFGGPVPEALVKVWRGQQDEAFLTQYTNADGLAKFVEVPAPETYFVKAFKWDRTSELADLRLEPGHEAEVILTIERPSEGGIGSLHGRVQHAYLDFGWLSGVSVRVFQNEVLKGEATTNGDGYYIINELAAGTYNVKFSKEGFETRWYEQIVIEEGGETELNAELFPVDEPENGVLFGHVYNGHDDSVIPGAGVKVYSGDLVVADATTNADGYYIIDGLPAGTYGVKFFKDGFTPRFYEQIVIIGGHETQRDAELFPAEPPANGVLFGHVYNAANEQPLNGVLVTVFKGEVEKGYSYTNADGYYLVDGLAAGWYSASFSLAGYETYWAYEIHIVGGQETEVNASLTPLGEPGPARMYGHVRNLEEQPLVGALVHLGHFEGDEYVIDYYASSGQEGYYVIEGIVPGAYVIRVVKEGYETLQQEIGFEPGDNRLVNFNMQGLG